MMVIVIDVDYVVNDDCNMMIVLIKGMMIMISYVW